MICKILKNMYIFKKKTKQGGKMFFKSKIFKTMILFLVVSFLISFSLFGCKEEAVSTEEAAEEVEEAAEEVEEAAEEVEAEDGMVDEVVIGTAGDNGSLDQMIENAVFGREMKQLMYNGLVDVDLGLNVVPSIAKSWDVSEDGLEYTFYLEEGILFHNGRELTAEDVKFSIERYQDPVLGSPYKNVVDRIVGLEVIDDYTIKFTLNEPISSFLIGIATGNVPMVAKESYNDDNTVADPIGTGPYKFIEWIPDDRFVIEAFDDYWAGAPNVAKITFKIIPDETIRLTALKTGDIDIMKGIPIDNLVSEINNPTLENVTLLSIPGSTYLYTSLLLNHNRAPFDDIKVRQAMLYAIDVQEIIDIVYFGLGVPATCPFAEGNVWYVPYDRPDVDQQKAKDLLAEAGYPDGFEFDLATTAIFGQVDKVATVIQAQLAEIGVTANVQVDELAAFIEREETLDFDAQFKAAGAYFDPEIYYSEHLRTGGPYHIAFGSWSDPEIDQLLDDGAVEVDVEKRKALYAQVTNILWRDLPRLELCNTSLDLGYSNEFANVKIHPARGWLIWNNNEGIPWLTKAE